MATSYTPNALDVTQPTSDKYVESAALEFRTLKTKLKNINDRLGYVETTGGGGTGVTNLDKAAIVGALVANGHTHIPFVRSTTWSGDIEPGGSSLVVTRNASYTGGANNSFGNRLVGHAIAASTTTGVSASNCEMALLGSVTSNADIDPSAVALGQSWPQNVGSVGHAFQFGSAPVWAGWFSAQNKTGNPQALNRGAVVGLEVNVGITGRDDYKSSFGISCVPQAMATGACSAHAAFWSSGSANETWQTGFLAEHCVVAGFHSDTNAQRAFNATGNYTVGLDTSNATITNAAIRIGRGTAIAFDKYDQYKMRLNSDSGLLEFFSGGTRHGFINLDSGADVDLAAGTSGGGTTDLSNYMRLTGGDQTVTAFTSFNNYVNIGPNYTASFSSTGNIRAAGGVSTQQLRILIDFNPYYIPIYSA